MCGPIPKFRNLLILFGDSINLQYVLVLKFSKTKNGCIKLGEHGKKLKTSGGFFSSPGLSMPKDPQKSGATVPLKSGNVTTVCGYIGAVPAPCEAPLLNVG